MLFREGITEHNIAIIAEGTTMYELNESVAEMDDTHSTVVWDDDIYEKNIIASRSEVFNITRSIARNHSITVQRDSTITSDRKWVAVYRQYVGFGLNKMEAVDRVVEQIEEGPNDYV